MFFFTEGVKVTSLDRMEDDVFFLFTEPEMFNTSRSVKVPRKVFSSREETDPDSRPNRERRQEISCPKRNNRYNRYYCHRFENVRSKCPLPREMYDEREYVRYYHYKQKGGHIEVNKTLIGKITVYYRLLLQTRTFR